MAFTDEIDRRLEQRMHFDYEGYLSRINKIARDFGVPHLDDNAEPLNVRLDNASFTLGILAGRAFDSARDEKGGYDPAMVERIERANEAIERPPDDTEDTLNKDWLSLQVLRSYIAGRSTISDKDEKVFAAYPSVVSLFDRYQAGLISSRKAKKEVDDLLDQIRKYMEVKFFRSPTDYRKWFEDIDSKLERKGFVPRRSLISKLRDRI